MATIGMYRAGQWCARRLPAGAAYWLADRIADVYHLASRRDRRIVRENLRAILGDEPRPLRIATRDVFRSFARYLADFLRIRRVDRAFIERHVEVTGLEHVERARADGRGIIALTAHLGHWELAGMAVQALGHPVSAVALSHEDALVNELFVTQRTTQGMEVIPMGQATRRCLASLREGRVLALLGDRDFSHHAAISALLFGRPTWIPRGPAILSIKTRRPVVPGFLVRLAGERFRLVFEPPIYPSAAGANEATVEQLTRRYVAVMERYIRAYPTQWFLFQPFWHRAQEPMRDRYRVGTGVAA